MLQWGGGKLTGAVVGARNPCLCACRCRWAARAPSLGSLASADWWPQQGAYLPPAPPHWVLLEAIRDIFQASSHCCGACLPTRPPACLRTHLPACPLP